MGQHWNGVGGVSIRIQIYLQFHLDGGWPAAYGFYGHSYPMLHESYENILERRRMRDGTWHPEEIPLPCFETLRHSIPMAWLWNRGHSMFLCGDPIRPPTTSLLRKQGVPSEPSHPNFKLLPSKRWRTTCESWVSGCGGGCPIDPHEASPHSIYVAHWIGAVRTANWIWPTKTLTGTRFRGLLLLSLP